MIIKRKINQDRIARNGTPGISSSVSQFSRARVSPATLPFILARHSVPCLVPSASLFGYWCSSLFLFLDRGSHVCLVAVVCLSLDFPQNLTGRKASMGTTCWSHECLKMNEGGLHLTQVLENEWKWTPPNGMMKSVANISSTFYCIYLLGRFWFLPADLAGGSKAKAVYILKSVLFLFVVFFYIKTTYIKPEATCPKVKVVLFPFDPNMLQNGLTRAVNPSVPEVPWRIIIICGSGPGWKSFFSLNNKLGGQVDGLEKPL